MAARERSSCCVGVESLLVHDAGFDALKRRIGSTTRQRQAWLEGLLRIKPTG